MIESKKISYNDLVMKINKKLMVNNTLKEEQINFLGQENAINSLDFGLQIQAKGYNIYLSGESGTHKQQYIQQYIEKIAKLEARANDWCYVYDFENELKPVAIELPSGMGKVFREDINTIISHLIEEINTCLKSEEHQDNVTKLKEFYYDEGERLLKQIKEEAKELGFYTQITESGLYFVPVFNGKKISEEMYDELSVEDQEKIINNLNDIEEKAEEIMETVKEYKKEAEERVKEYEDKTVKNIIEITFKELEKKYLEFNKVGNYLRDLKKDLLKQINELIGKEEDNDKIKALIGSIVKEDDEFPKKYSVNLIVDNSSLEGAPVVYCGNPSFNNIVGRVEYENELGNLVTDFTKIKGGLLHKANGGYLILNTNDVISSPFVWEFLKKAIINEKIEFENIREKLGGVPLRTVIPEPIPLNVKVILIGNQYLYHLIYQYDQDFKEIFKVHVVLDYEMDRNDKTVSEYNYYIDKYTNEKAFLPINSDAKKRLLYFASKLSGNRKKLSTKISYVENIIDEANYWAKKEGDTVIYDYHIKKAILEKEKRISFIKEKLYEMITNRKIKIEVEGLKVGQINGLAIMEYGECCFGKPTRITATTYMGQSGMVNIEKEAELSGSIHNKGVNILEGYLGQKYAQEIPLALSCRLCFEQNYSGIDGDSASSAELYAILSSLADIPLNQSIAVTGSVDQRGNIQPVGGVTEKVEGFYRICKKADFTGKQGVIIPKENVEELVLADDLLEDIKRGRFSIYAIEHIEEGIELLTEKKMGTIDSKIRNKLEKYYNNANKTKK
ncbi:MAG: Lon protease family protein [Eubacteriales bacterium]